MIAAEQASHVAAISSSAIVLGFTAAASGVFDVSVSADESTGAGDAFVADAAEVLRVARVDSGSFAFDYTPSHCFEIDQGSLGTNRFAASASRVYSLSPISDDEPTSAGGAGGADAPPPNGSGGGGSGDPKAKLVASLVFDALVRLGDPQNHNVLLTEAGLADALLEHGLIEWKSNEGRETMKTVVKTLEGFDWTLTKVEKTIEDRKHDQALLAKSINCIFNRILSSFFKKIGFLSPFIKKIDFLSSFINKFMGRREAKRRQHEEIEGELGILRKDRRTLANKVERKKVNDEWLGRMKRCDDRDCYVYLTLRGQQLLERMEGDRKLEYLTFEDYMRLYGSEDGA